jgi:serine/threonine protein kinase
LASLAPYPNIPAVYELNETEQCFFYTREYVDGATLRESVEAGAIGHADGLRILADIRNALSSVHDNGLAHRNLGPDNVLVSRTGVAKLIGFSRATITDASIAGDAGASRVEADIKSLERMRDWMLAKIT